MAGSEVTSDRRLGRGGQACNRFATLRGPCRRRDNERSGPIQVRDARQARRRGRLRLGLLWIQVPYPLLRQVRLVSHFCISQFNQMYAMFYNPTCTNTSCFTFFAKSCSCHFCDWTLNYITFFCAWFERILIDLVLPWECPLSLTLYLFKPIYIHFKYIFIYIYRGFFYTVASTTITTLIIQTFWMVNSRGQST